MPAPAGRRRHAESTHAAPRPKRGQIVQRIRSKRPHRASFPAPSAHSPKPSPHSGSLFENTGCRRERSRPVATISAAPADSMNTGASADLPALRVGGGRPALGWGRPQANGHYRFRQGSERQPASFVEGLLEVAVRDCGRFFDPMEIDHSRAIRSVTMRAFIALASNPRKFFAAALSPKRIRRTA